MPDAKSRFNLHSLKIDFLMSGDTSTVLRYANSNIIIFKYSLKMLKLSPF